MKKSLLIGAGVLFVAVSAAQASDTVKGKQVYETACFACHAKGIANAPKLGDKPNWAPRIKQGLPALTSHAVKGYQGKGGFMPPKGGRADLSDDDVKAAVAYMIEQSK